MALDWKIFTQRPYIASLSLEEQTRLFYIANEKSIRYRSRSGTGDTGPTFTNTFALNFDGTDDYVETNVSATGTDFSFSCWLKHSGNFSGFGDIAFHSLVTTNISKGGFYLFHSSGTHLVLRSDLDETRGTTQ
jgi:hypothetical protein